ncbi:hypothetical protein IY145_17765 [Methylosinus sp. H3A]|uniref:hypothetical protein n=1 Tax=Methylosinus sp. H3A TaxID=2785786 RepID=UPI0018C2F631|nr:hypothetical protein [Methylosinus sp. H3A]MBG0811206.1 hypothetical protein [Methylosinus sp. H3A]
MSELHHAPQGANENACPDRAAEQRAALADLVERGEIAERTRASAAETFALLLKIPPESRDLVRARQFGEHIGAETERLREQFRDNPAAAIVRRIIEDIWTAAYGEAEREFDSDPTEIARAMDANQEAHRSLELAIKDRAQECFDELQLVERAEALPGVDKRVAAGFLRGRAVGRLVGALRATFDPSSGIDGDELESVVVAAFNRQMDVLAQLSATPAAGAA